MLKYFLPASNNCRKIFSSAKTIFKTHYILLQVYHNYVSMSNLAALYMV